MYTGATGANHYGSWQTPLYSRRLEMRTWKKKRSRFREILDTVIAASTLAQAGEVELARKMMSDVGAEKPCCGEIAAGRECAWVFQARCDLAQA
jgi:hypothetical protein